MKKYYFYILPLVIVFAIFIAILEQKKLIPMADTKAFEVLLQFIIISVIGAFAKVLLEKINKEKIFYDDVVKNYNKAKKIRRDLKTACEKKVDYNTLISYRNHFDKIQLEFERLRDYFIINEDIHSNLNRKLIFKSIVGLEVSLRCITEEMEEKDKKGNLEQNGIDLKGFDILYKFVNSKGNKNLFIKSFDDFQETTFGYEEKKKKLAGDESKKDCLETWGIN